MRERGEGERGEEASRQGRKKGNIKNYDSKLECITHCRSGTCDNEITLSGINLISLTLLH